MCWYRKSQVITWRRYSDIFYLKKIIWYFLPEEDILIFPAMSSSTSTMKRCLQPLKKDNCDEVEKNQYISWLWNSKRKFKSCSLRAVKVPKSICNFSSCESFPIICVLNERILFHFSSQIHLFMIEIVHHRLRQRPQVWDKERRAG